MLYAGQERSCTHRPSLFDEDKLDWSGEDITDLLQILAKLKRNPILTNSRYEVHALPRDILYASHRKGERRLIGIFSVQGNNSLVEVDAADGIYSNLVDGRMVEVYSGMVCCEGVPIIFEV